MTSGGSEEIKMSYLGFLESNEHIWLEIGFHPQWDMIDGTPVLRITWAGPPDDNELFISSSQARTIAQALTAAADAMDAAQ